jgi:hypothetical protein
MIASSPESPITMPHLTNAHPIRTRRDPSAVAALADGFPFAVSEVA